MKKVVLLLLMSILVISGCGDKKDNGTVTQYQSKVEEKTDTYKAKGTNDIIDISHTSIYRISDKKDKDGRDEPPYIEAGVMFTMDKKPEAGALVTIVPIAVNIPAFSAPIQKIEEGSEEVSENSTLTWFNIEVGNIDNKEILSCSPLAGRAGEYPFDVSCIYPALEYARNLDIKNIKTGELLPYEAKGNIICAIDVNMDNSPDLLITEEKDSDYTISCYYIKRNGEWKVFKEKNPM